MSVEASRWAIQADVQRSSSKLVLLNLAQLVRYDAAEWTAFASIEYLAKVTHLNRKTMIDALTRLHEMGAIQDTGTFTAYWRSRAGDAALSADWFESWRLWVFREHDPQKAHDKSWQDSWSGIVAKGKSLCLYRAPDKPEAYFKLRVSRRPGCLRLIDTYSQVRPDFGTSTEIRLSPKRVFCPSQFWASLVPKTVRR
ncbi:hypothetical protein CAL29_22895 [Bordetella genomosp. 10]|uniref:Uncharacterized protein n=1 Tax=Bordetella genomosp. 10 TaxID=1416804 RepID=A0A261S0F7_9BORD|nr:helix-turn-helix domain-containing protein [Bordetella genomosp. 10]OZI30828.1 hypothetical protein CAL29_22895 [Bordetella genomosp. 10]